MSYYDAETAVFEAKLPGWLKSCPDQWVAIKGQEVLGPFESNEAAFREAVRTFQSDEFLLRQVTAEEEVLTLPFVSAVKSDG